VVRAGQTLATSTENIPLDAASPAAGPHEDGPLIPQIAQFLKRYWFRMLAISAAMLIPCFWHRRIVSSDLGSHLYNAWLAQLVDHGQVTGMWVAHQWTNVLFDLLLSAVGTFANLHTAETVVVSFCVLIFFWGTFSLVCAAAKRAPWFILPFLALATYGWTFHMGFFNYYLSLGLAFFGVAIFWRGQGWERLLPLALLPFITLAHPLGLVWLVAAGAYVAIGARFSGYLQWGLFLLGAGLIVGGRYFIVHHYYIQESMGSFLKYNGADQVVLFGDRYNWLKTAVIVVTLLLLAIDAVRRWLGHVPWGPYAIPAQLYLIIGLAVGMFPSGVVISRDLAAVALLTERLTSVAAVLACCLLGAMIPSRWHLLATGAVAAVFFVYVYQDTAVVNRIELQAEELVRTLPRDSRVMATIYPLPDSRILIQHIVDRACIGYCFSYGNYEPGTGLFHVRAVPGGPYALGDYGLSVDMEEGVYVVQPRDLPVYQVFQCTVSGTVLCVRPLQVGEKNNRLAVYGSD
jgi:hypothetical protein